jgi:hypothetical protein
METIELGINDSAIIFRANGKPEIVMTEQEDNELAQETSYQVLLCTYFLFTPHLVDEVRKNMDSIMESEN